MLILSKIYLHNWHRFKDHTLEVEDGLFLSGLNGSGKSSILDAIQMVLVADLQKTKFNSSAQERTSRNLDGYVRGKMGEDRFLRKGNAVCYIALEFRSTNAAAQQQQPGNEQSLPQQPQNSRPNLTPQAKELGENERFLTLGVCIEAGPDRHPERSWFIQKKGFDRTTIIDQGVPLTRRELRSLFRKKSLGETYDQVSEYQPALLKSLGGMGEQFFDLFMKALTFLPLRDVRAFVEQWLLERSSLDVENLRHVSDRLADLHAHCSQMQNQIEQLGKIEVLQHEVVRLKALQVDFTSLKILSDKACSEQTLTRIQGEQKQKESMKLSFEKELSTLSSELSILSQKELDLQVSLASSELGRQKLQMERELQTCLDFKTKHSDLTKSYLQHRANFLNSIALLAFPPEMSEDAKKIKDFFESEVLQTETKYVQEDAKSNAQVAAQGNVECPSLRNETFAELRKMRDAQIESQAVAKHRLRHNLQRIRGIETELSKLKSGQKAKPPRNAEELRSLIEAELNCPCQFLYELLEVRDERWQNAVEAMLGARRFLIVVPEEHYDRASEILEYQRKHKGLTDASLLDTHSVQKEARIRGTSTVNDLSLAAIVHVDRLDLRAYIRLVLGDIQRVNSVLDLRKHRRAITAECVLYSEWSVRAIPKHRFEPWYLGVRAIQSQEKQLRAEGLEISAAVTKDNEFLSQHTLLLKAYDCEELLNEKFELLSLNSAARKNIEQLEDLKTSLASLDFSSLVQIQKSLEEVKAEIATQRRSERHKVESLAKISEQIERLVQDLRIAESNDVQLASRRDDWALHQPESFARGMSLLHEKATSQGFEAVSKNAEMASKTYETRAMNETQKLIEFATSYNISFQFAGNPADPKETKYQSEKQRLVATALPEYKSQIELEQRRAEQELREHILHRLREKIVGARAQLEGVNRSLKGLQFNDETYRFRWYPADDLREFYDLIVDARQIGNSSLMESEWYLKNQVSFDRFYEMLTTVPQNEQERRTLERLTDYRAYLTYDIEVTHANGQVSRLSKIIGQTSGGETQTPFYITIAASFLQLYSAREKLGFSCPRLICFDEAFSKMDQERISATLDAFQKFNLQVVIATPLERSEYIVPKIKTSLVVTAVGDGVIVEPYRNYLASLGELILEHDDKETEVSQKESNLPERRSFREETTLTPKI